MNPIQKFSHLNCFTYIDSNGSSKSCPIQVNFNSNSNMLKVTSLDTKVNNLAMEINLNLEAKDHHNLPLYFYTINYMDGSSNLNGIEFGQARIETNEKGELELCSLTKSFSIKKNQIDKYST